MGGCFQKKAAVTVNTNANANVNTNTGGNVAMKMYSIVEQNDSNQGGMLTLTEVDGKTRVLLEVDAGPEGVEQPAHIHNGSCADLGTVAYGLNNVVDGKSETFLAVSIADLLLELPLAVNVHESTEAINTYTACGDLDAMGMIHGDGNANTNVNANANANVNANVNVNRNTNANANVNANTNVNANVNVNANINANLNANVNVGVDAKVFTVTARNFAFSQKEIRVKKGDTVRINLTSVEGFHDWVLPEFEAATKQISAGNSSSVEFTASKTGTFEYYCSVGSHRQMGMIGTLIVE